MGDRSIAQPDGTYPNRLRLTPTALAIVTLGWDIPQPVSITFPIKAFNTSSNHSEPISREIMVSG